MWIVIVNILIIWLMDCENVAQIAASLQAIDAVSLSSPRRFFASIATGGRMFTDLV